MTLPSHISTLWQQGKYEQALTDLGDLLDAMAAQDNRWQQDADTCQDMHRQWRAERLRSQARGEVPSRELLAEIGEWVGNTVSKLERAIRDAVNTRSKGSGIRWTSVIRDQFSKLKDLILAPKSIDSPVSMPSQRAERKSTKPESGATPPQPPIPQPAPLEPEDAMEAPAFEEALEEAAPPEPETPEISFSPFAQPYATCDWVNVSMYAPEQVQAGHQFLVTTFAHLFEQTELVEKMAREADPDNVRQGGKTLNTAIERGSALQFQLSIQDWDIDEPVQSVVWLGMPASAEFLVTVPTGASGKVFGKLIVIGEKGPVGSIRFNLQVGSMGESQPSPATTNVTTFRNTYLAYAPEDASNVIALEPQFQAAGWQWHPTAPGPATALPDWENEAIPAIRSSELFVLFWSGAADNSARVALEWEVALGARISDNDGKPDLLAVNLGSPVPEPPDQLAFLPFLSSFTATLPPLPERPTFSEDDTTLKRLADEYVATGNVLVFEILKSRAAGDDLNLVIGLENAWHTLARNERLMFVTPDQARSERSRLNSSILSLVGRLFG